jgi:hypothetical protein
MVGVIVGVIDIVKLIVGVGLGDNPGVGVIVGVCEMVGVIVEVGVIVGV